MIRKRIRQIFTAATATALILTNNVSDPSAFASFASEAKKATEAAADAATETLAAAADSLANKTDPAEESDRGSARNKIGISSPDSLDKAEKSTPDSAEKPEASPDSLDKSGEKTLINDLKGQTAASEDVEFDPVYFDDGSSVEVSAPADAFPEGTSLSVTQVMDDDILDAVRKASSEENLTADDLVAYDFNFYTDEQDHIEPEKEISVRFNDVALAGDTAPEVYHVDDGKTDVAEKMEVQNSDLADDKVSVEISAASFSKYVMMRAPAKTKTEKTEKTGIWIDDGETSTNYNTLSAAVEAANAGTTIYMAGDINGSKIAGATVGSGITLEVYEDTTITGDGSQNGFTLNDGARLKCDEGVKLTMTGFKTAVTVNKRAEINDGNYEFEGNAGPGLKVYGAIVGSSSSGDKKKLEIIAKDKNETNFYEGSAKFTNCAINVSSSLKAGIDGRALNMNNASMTISGFKYGFFIAGGAIRNHSFLHMTSSENNASTAITFQRDTQGKATEIESSTIQTDYGYKDGISVGLSNKSTEMIIKDSTLNLNNIGFGGLNINTGTVILEDS